MNIEKQNIDDLTSLLKVKVEKNDYEPRVKKSLNDYRRKAEIKGFRTGMAPIGLIQKMYGRSVMVDEINKLISDSLSDFISNEQLDLIGEPIPCDREQKPIDWDNDNEFEFVYEIGISSPLEVELNKRVQVPYYKITVSDTDKQEHINYIQRRFGQLIDAEEVGDEDSITVDFTQEGENALNVENTMVWVKSIEDEKIRKKIVGKKIGSSIKLDVKKTFTNEADLAAMLHIKKEELEQLDPNYTMTIKGVKTLLPAELNQELFDKVYGEGVVTTEADFMQRIEDEIAKHYTTESDIRFNVDARKVLTKKADLKLPDEFLKRWLIVVGDGKYTQEDIDREFDMFVDNLRWQKIVNYFAKQQDIKITGEEIQERAMKIARDRFAQYGLNYLPEDQMMHYVGKMLEDREEVNRIAEHVLENKVIDYVKGQVKLSEKEITFDELRKLYEQK